MKQFPNTTFEVEWKPFFLNTELTEEGISMREYIQRVYGRTTDPADPSNPLNKAGRAVGIHFNPDRKMHNTLRSHRLVEYAKKQGKQNEAIEAVFRHYFENADNIANVDKLCEISAEIGLTGDVRAYLQSEADQDTIRQQYETARRQRISGVPYIIISKHGKRNKLAMSGAQPPEAFAEAFQELLD